MADMQSGAVQPATTPKRLALFFDGTWNTPKNDTNVWRLRQLVSPCGQDGIPQPEPFYDEGVGTHWFDRISGGAFGAGLWKNVCRGYQWLAERYNPGDEVFLFGFSRGAFTARSVAGLIARCGLLKRGASMDFDQVFARYRRGSDARAIYVLKYLQKTGQTSDFTAEEKALVDNVIYDRDLIKMVGVWDTVGSIGVPFGNLPGISSRTLQFHDTHLSVVVQNSFQALAVDEHRKPYWAILWTWFYPDTPLPPGHQHRTDDRMIEQRWFAGCHTDVGGGGDTATVLSDRPLAWIQARAQSCGLGFKQTVAVTDADLTTTPFDSYSAFLGGVWKSLSFLPFAKYYDRWIQSAPVPKKTRASAGNPSVTGQVKTVRERIDQSVFEHCRRVSDYRPTNLLEWAKRKEPDFEAFLQDPGRWTKYTAPVTEPGLDGP